MVRRVAASAGRKGKRDPKLHQCKNDFAVQAGTVLEVSSQPLS